MPSKSLTETHIVNSIWTKLLTWIHTVNPIRYENANRNEQSEPHLDENVAIFGFGDSLEYVSGISLRFKTKLHLRVNKLYKV